MRRALAPHWLRPASGALDFLDLSGQLESEKGPSRGKNGRLAV